MDISNEASVDPFKIGPSTICGRTIAFRVLFCKSMSHLRYQIFHMVLNYLHKLKNNVTGYLSPLISCLHPRNPQGILVMVSLIAFVLRRYGSNIKSSRNNSEYRRKHWRNMMRDALTYEGWAHAAKMLDKENPRLNESNLYDEELVKSKLQELRHRRHDCSLRDIIFGMRADLIRNLGNMCNSELHKGKLHVPGVIKDYIDEVSTQLRMVCDSNSEELSLEEKLSFMHETRHSFGRTALLLSGGASFGAFHVGVAKTLVEHKLLPRIIAGSSVGSVMCAVIATKSWPELQSFFEDTWSSYKYFEQLDGVFACIKRVMTRGALLEIQHLQLLLRHLTNNLTFQEAYDLTGRILGITVCSARKHEPPRVLNYLTSPHVVIWSAVTASCAFPGLFEAQELMAKDRSGKIVPYHPPFHLGTDNQEAGSAAPERRWRDGSLEIDLPMMQLKELFNVNHFIVSQANPHITPLLRLKEFVRAYGGNFACKVAHLVEMEVKHRCNQLLELGFTLGGLPRLFAQDWEGDVTVVMPATLAHYSKIITNPTLSELHKTSNQGRRCTWEKLSAIKANCGIELALDECVSKLNHIRQLKRSAKRSAAAAASHYLPSPVRFSAYKRIPSWNCIARENSSGSLEDYFHAASSPRQGDVGRSPLPSPSPRNWRPHRNIFDHGNSDSESETADSNCWTRCGGPLMRTNSSNDYTESVQNLEMVSSKSVIQTGARDPCYQKLRVVTPDRRNSFEFQDIINPVSSNSSILVGEGEFLQAERTHNGIMFNVVKKETLTPSSRSTATARDDSESVGVLDCPEKETDSTTSECGEDFDSAVDHFNVVERVINSTVEVC